MNNIEIINSKLLSFIKKYYINELIKGILLFFCIGLLYFISTLLLEYFFWFSTQYRTVLFWSFILVELFLFYKFIGISLFKLFGFKKGISNEDASTIIGTHFPEVNDKLINLLQLQNSNNNSELLLASIEQKANSLVPIPFNIAVNFKTNYSYLKYLLVPLIILFCIYISGNKSIIQNSYDRVFNYNTAYTRPAPFKFLIKNHTLNTTENQAFILEVTTVGDVVPSDIKINFNNESYYLHNDSFNFYSFIFENVKKPITFFLESNSIISNDYTLNIVNVPTITDFKIDLIFPKYLNLKNKSIANSGDLIVPEGTAINWSLFTKSTDRIVFQEKDSSYLFDYANGIFNFSKFCNTSFDYQISTNNKFISNHEILNYQIKVLKDNFPTINLNSKIDTLSFLNTRHFLGNISDDYGLKKLSLHFKNLSTGISKVKNIPIGTSNIQQFLFSFPGDLVLDDGTSYEYFFRVTDNDKLNNFKSTNSISFVYNNISSNELLSKKLQDQENNLSNFSKIISKQKKSNESFIQIKNLQKENNTLNWNDKKNISNFIKTQQLQQNKLKDLSNKLSNSLKNIIPDSTSDNLYKYDLIYRLSKQEEKLKKNEDLLDELSKIQDKLKAEDLLSKLSKFSKNTQNQERSLEQILELTKRYYVSQKANKIANDLLELSIKQDVLSKEKNDNQLLNQKEINNNFNSINKEFQDLIENNTELKRPVDLKDDSELRNSILKILQNTLKNISDSNFSNSKKNQQSSSKKMKELSSSIKSQFQNSSKDQLLEDKNMLRQILDNLINFSFSQEFLMNDFKSLNESNFDYSYNIKKQFLLKDNFHHIDDSLFALSLRNPKISDIINNEINEINFNIDNAINRFENQNYYLGISNQQYVLTSANNLADLLSTILNSIQDKLNSISSSAPGSSLKPGDNSSGFQLSDIIQSQDALSKKISDSGKGQNGNIPSQNSNLNNSSNSNLDVNGENSSGELYEIYKQQQILKNQYKNLLEKKGFDNTSNSIVKQFDKIEKSLLDNGLSNSTLQQMNILKHQLLQLDKASFQQGQKDIKESSSNSKLFINKLKPIDSSIKQYFNEIEFLNRQALPLYPIYKNKVKSYFNNYYD